MMKPLERMQLCFTGLCVGDALGELLYLHQCEATSPLGWKRGNRFQTISFAIAQGLIAKGLRHEVQGFAAVQITLLADLTTKELDEFPHI